MGGNSVARAVSILVAVIVVSSMSGCQTPVRQDYGDRSPNIAPGTDATQLSAVLREYAIAFGRQVESAADHIAEATSDHQIRMNALSWKINALASSRVALFKAEPIFGLADGWVFARQMHQYLTVGDGTDLFGPHQDVAVTTAAELETLIIRVADSVAKDEEALAFWKRNVDAWADANPLQSLSMERIELMRLDLEEMQDTRGLLSTVASFEDLAFDVSEWTNIALHDLPRQMRWEAEYAVANLAESEMIADIRDDLQRLHALEKLDDLGRIDDLNATLEKLDVSLLKLDERIEEGLSHKLPEAIGAERGMVLDEIERQRLETLEVIVEQVGKIVETIADERSLILNEVQMHEDTIIQQIDAIGTRKILEARGEAVAVADYVLARVVAIIAALVGLYLVLMIVRGVIARAYRARESRPS